eukprot:scaffold30909_cov22-Tisochrysis_lutea.AAC.1
MGLRKENSTCVRARVRSMHQRHAARTCTLMGSKCASSTCSVSSRRSGMPAHTLRCTTSFCPACTSPDMGDTCTGVGVVCQGWRCGGAGPHTWVSTDCQHLFSLQAVQGREE